MSTNALSASLEEYLKTIYLLSSASDFVRATDIGKHLGVSQPSVTGALRQLSKKGFVKYAPYREVTLTTEGRDRALEVLNRYQALRGFMENVLCVSESEAKEAAGAMEHVMSPLVVERLIRYVHFVENCTQHYVRWQEGKGFCCQQVRFGGKRCDHCSLPQETETCGWSTAS